jgi:hypothetical protein
MVLVNASSSSTWTDEIDTPEEVVLLVLALLLVGYIAKRSNEESKSGT